MVCQVCLAWKVRLVSRVPKVRRVKLGAVETPALAELEEPRATPAFLAYLELAATPVCQEVMDYPVCLAVLVHLVPLVCLVLVVCQVTLVRVDQLVNLADLDLQVCPARQATQDAMVYQVCLDKKAPLALWDSPARTEGKERPVCQDSAE